MNIANTAGFPSDSTAPVPNWTQDGLIATLPKNRPSSVYLLALALVTATMLLLRVVYTALTGLAGYGVYYYATHHFHAIMAMDNGGSGRLALIQFFCAFVPIIVGSLVVVFMVKPLFAGPVE